MNELIPFGVEVLGVYGWGIGMFLAGIFVGIWIERRLKRENEGL